ncbi:hypothetical protein [Actinomadura roseirufa]|uniref:hypothetical protein n=1 Tax=Actinomadura roseirufa TaxID=2094049 RepID=UPI0010419BFC|nr:hypothetical protein [Actinomadura roseirufa]
MTKLLLSVHVLAAILAIGPVAVAASMFPRYARAPERDGTAVLLHRVCRVYSGVGLVVPLFGFLTGARLGVLGDPWLIASIVLTGIAAGVLMMAILPGQQRLLATGGGAGATAPAARLAAQTGVFNLLWAVVTVLMIVRPGSTTGV